MRGLRTGSIAVLLALALAVAFPAAVHGQPVMACNASAIISQTASAVVVTGVAGTRIFICGITVNASAATATFALVEGTGTVCATNTVALIGDNTNKLTPSVGPAYSATSNHVWLQTKVAGDDLCLTQTGAGTLAGVISYVQRPQ